MTTTTTTTTTTVSRHQTEDEKWSDLLIKGFYRRVETNMIQEKNRSEIAKDKNTDDHGGNKKQVFERKTSQKWKKAKIKAKYQTSENKWQPEIERMVISRDGKKNGRRRWSRRSGKNETRFQLNDCSREVEMKFRHMEDNSGKQILKWVHMQNRKGEFVWKQARRKGNDHEKIGESEKGGQRTISGKVRAENLSIDASNSAKNV